MLYFQSKSRTTLQVEKNYPQVDNPQRIWRLAVCVFFLLCVFAGAAWAEGAPTTAVVVFSDGQKVEFGSGDPRDPLEALKTLLFDQRDGTCEVQEDGKPVLIMVKTGDEVKLTSHGNEKTLTLQAAREELELANALSEASLKNGTGDELDPEAARRLKEPLPNP